MKNNLEFYRCKVCGNTIIKLVDSGVGVVCCDAKMSLLEAGVEDASVEKHVPAYIEKDGKVKIQIGSDIHPMEEKHYIQFIIATDNEHVLLKKLSHDEEPVLDLSINPETLTTSYEFCNLHGLWRGEK